MMKSGDFTLCNKIFHVTQKLILKDILFFVETALYIDVDDEKLTL